jgi:hypothetical protein
MPIRCDKAAKGSAEAIGMKEIVSSAARHRKPLTPMPPSALFSLSPKG